MKLLKQNKNKYEYFDSDFENWNVDEGLTAKRGTTVAVLTEDKTYSQIYTDPETQCVSQEDVMDFIESHQDDLKEHWHHFLIKNSKGEFFVVRVVLRGGGLFFNLSRLDYAHVWYGNYRYRYAAAEGTSILNAESLGTSDSLTLERAISLCKASGYQVIKQM